MQRFRNILVGVDLPNVERPAASELSPPTTEAVTRGIQLASWTSGQLTFFSVLDVSAQTQESLDEESEPGVASMVDNAESVLAELVDRAKQQNVAASSRLAFGSPWMETVRQVLRERHDLCIVGTRQRGAARRLLFGSNGAKLLRNCPCPVWVTRPDPDMNDLNILVPSDFSGVSSLALEIAVNAGQLVDSKIHLLHAIDDPVGRRMRLTGLPSAEAGVLDQRKRDESLRSLSDQLARTDYRALEQGVQLHVVEGPADIVVLDAIEQYEIDLLVMGTAARGGIGGVLIGNTAERLLPHVPCSVLALKPEGWECPFEAE